MKYYKSGRIYYKFTDLTFEKVYAFKYCFGIEKNLRAWINIDPDDTEGYEITETQYLRVRKLILAKIQ
jgi:hypothetical protein